MRTADTIERAIEIVCTEHTECQLPWGKTSAELRQACKERNIDTLALGVFIAGRIRKDGTPDEKPETLTFLPESWMDRDSDLLRLAGIRQ